MKLSEQIKSDIEKVKKMDDPKKQVRFIWDYYHIPILVITAVVVLTVISVISGIGRNKICMYAVLVNNDSMAIQCDDTVFVKQLEKAGFDTQGKTVDVEVKYSIGQGASETSDMETLQALTALFTISDMDIYVCDKQYFDYFCDHGGYADLSKLIDKEILDKVQEDLYYYTDSSGNTALVGIVLHQGSLLHQAGYYHNDVIMGVTANARSMDAAVAFITQLLKDRN